MQKERPPSPPSPGSTTGSLTTFPSTPCPNLYPHPNPRMFHPTSSLHLFCSRVLHVNLSLGPFTPCSLLITSFCPLLTPPTAYNETIPQLDKYSSILHDCTYAINPPPILCRQPLVLLSVHAGPTSAYLSSQFSYSLIPLPMCTCCHIPFHQLANTLLTSPRGFTAYSRSVQLPLRNPIHSHLPLPTLLLCHFSRRLLPYLLRLRPHNVGLPHRTQLCAVQLFSPNPQYQQPVTSSTLHLHCHHP